jgi:hypothetical protein
MAKKKAKAKKTKPKNPPGMVALLGGSDPVPAKISSAGVVLDPVVKVEIGQDLKWIAQNRGGPWTISFEASPFSQSVYWVPKGGTESTAGGAAPGSVGKIFPYTVSDQNNQKTGEGDVIIV